MIHVSRLVAVAATSAALCVPAGASPVIGFATGLSAPSQHLAPPRVIRDCGDTYNEYEGEGEGEGGTLTEACFDGGGSNRDDAGPSDIDLVVDSVEGGIEHCTKYSPEWRVDCLSNELERMAARMPGDGAYGRAKAEVLATAAKLKSLAQQNADPAKPAIRRAANVGGKRRTTTRPITAVAPDRVAATNAIAQNAITELSTTLLRSGGSSPSTSREIVRVAQAVDSTKVLLRSI